MPDFTARISDLSDHSLAPENVGKLHLMAASAGTGKTYSIQTIYLRLILIEGLTVQQILTVTFTKDATKELRDRLQAILRDALDYLENTRSIQDKKDRTKIIVDLACGTGPNAKQKASERLHLALLDFDLAAIYTIHGFCQRVLTRFAFETRQSFDMEPATDTDEEIKQLCRDWWRKNVYSIDEDTAAILAGHGKLSLHLITELSRKLISKPDALLDDQGHKISQARTEMENQILAFNQLPPTAEETEAFPHACDRVRDALDYLQKRVKVIRDFHGNEIDAAVNALADICAFGENIPIPEFDMGTQLKKACEQFMAHVPKGIRANSFAFDEDACLHSPKCPELLPEHTHAIRDAAARLAELETTIEMFRPFSIRQNASFASYRLLSKPIGISDNPAAPDLYKAIKAIADNKCGIAQNAKLNITSINQAFYILHKQLLRETILPVYQAALEIKTAYQQSRSAARTASFNDYLVNLREALKINPDLIEVLRNEFRAALIDEFQDTDPIQWDIFKTLFKDSTLPCFLVGDPKQAIYRFRNGDIETYLQATNDIHPNARYELQKNFRSEKRLIDAVNQIFMDKDGACTFGERIPYATPLDAAGKDRDKSLLVNNEPDQCPFKVMLIPNHDTRDNHGKNSYTARLAYRVTAQEIARTLADKNQTIAGNAIEPGDIAVLVSKHAEGSYIAEELKKLNIPTVRQGTGEVWQTDEGRNLLTMLEAILDARNPNLLRAALISSWGGLSTSQILELNAGNTIRPPYGDGAKRYAIEQFVEIFGWMAETWQERGFPAMFRYLQSTFHLKQRLLANPDKQGQRRITNMIHLEELVEREIIQHSRTPDTILTWVRRQFSKETADSGEETKLRLDTDDKAVKIMTIFTSKGLEFPIVFAPTLFMMQNKTFGKTYEYHDENGMLRVIPRTGDDGQDTPHKTKEKAEVERELVRQMYVALTRAVHRTVIIAIDAAAKAGKPKKGEQQAFTPIGALGNLLHLPLKADNGIACIDIHNVPRRFENITDVPCAIEVQHGDKKSEPQPLPQAPIAIIPTSRERPLIDTTRGHGSFSSIAPHAAEKMQNPSNQSASENERKDNDESTVQPIEPSSTIKPEGIFAFPSGAHTGTCWHEIFEELDFSRIEEDKILEDIVEDKLETYGFLKKQHQKAERLNVTIQMVQNVLCTTLPKPPRPDVDKPFAFKNIMPANRKTEWEFSFAARTGKCTAEIKNAIAAFEFYKPFTEALGAWNKKIPSGYMTGFVDLLFRHDGRYYIADWKSNRRNGTQDDFGADGICEEMSTHRYWLQYMVYTVAVHQYLSNALPGYSYEKHFGGVYYVFLRGVDGQATNGQPNGIYYDLPPLELIQNLSSILGDFA